MANDNLRRDYPSRSKQPRVIMTRRKWQGDASRIRDEAELQQYRKSYNTCRAESSDCTYIENLRVCFTFVRCHHFHCNAMNVGLLVTTHICPTKLTVNTMTGGWGPATHHAGRSPHTMVSR